MELCPLLGSTELHNDGLCLIEHSEGFLRVGLTVSMLFQLLKRDMYSVRRSGKPSVELMRHPKTAFICKFRIDCAKSMNAFTIALLASNSLVSTSPMSSNDLRGENPLGTRQGIRRHCCVPHVSVHTVTVAGNAREVEALETLPGEVLDRLGGGASWSNQLA